MKPLLLEPASLDIYQLFASDFCPFWISIYTSLKSQKLAEDWEAEIDSCSTVLALAVGPPLIGAVIICSIHLFPEIGYKFRTYLHIPLGW